MFRIIVLGGLFLGGAALAGPYVEGCVQMHLFHLSGGDVGQLKAHLKKSCECQERELRKRGVSSRELADFVKGAGQAAVDPAAAQVAPHINPILQSPEVKERCQSLIP